VNVTERLARFLAETESAPDEALEAARRAVLDTLGVAIAGSREESARIAAALAVERGGREEATLLGRDERLPAPAAAFVNGVAGHALDFDDVSAPMRGHPSVVLLPAVLALGEASGSSGRDLLTAFVLGFEVQAKLGRAIGERHYERGWHATSTFGTIGAAAACARLLRLDAAATQSALGVAASMAAGHQRNFGSMTKHLHAGNAARSGLEAAQLAGRGFTADPAALEGPGGFLALMGDGPADLAPFETLGDPFEVTSSGVGVKLYPCCYATHRALNAALELRERHAIDPAAIDRVRVEVARGGLLPLRSDVPNTGLEGKFSMEYCLAAAFLDGAVGLASFADEAVLRPAARELMSRVETSEGEEPGEFPIGGYADVRIALRDGTEHGRRVDVALGDPARPVSYEQLVAKFRDCCQGVLSPEAVDRALAAIERLADLPDVRELTAALAPAGAVHSP
jgi:2-methylcitrate dehydratase PrpD